MLKTDSLCFIDASLFMMLLLLLSLVHCYLCVLLPNVSICCVKYVFVLQAVEIVTDLLCLCKDFIFFAGLDLFACGAQKTCVKVFYRSYSVSSALTLRNRWDFFTLPSAVFTNPFFCFLSGDIHKAKVWFDEESLRAECIV